MEISATVDTRAVIADLQRAGRAIDDAMYDWVEDVQSRAHLEMATYPAQRPGSRYVRTDTLKGSWHKEQPVVSGNEVRGRVVSNGNAADYNQLVQDRTRQARVHRDLWTNTAQAVTERITPWADDMFAARIAAAVG